MPKKANAMPAGRALRSAPASGGTAARRRAPTEVAANEVLERLRGIAIDMLEGADERRLRQLVDAVLPEIQPADPNVSTEAQMLLRARREILASGEWITSAQIAERAGWTGKNPSARTNRWKSMHQVFAIQHRGIDYFPLYALDQSRWSPRPELKPVIEVLRQHRDDWGIAYWFDSVNGYLGGRTPKQVLLEDGAAVIRAAQAEIEQQLHPHG